MRDWWKKAKCFGMPTSLFFPDLESAKNGTHVWADARTVCEGCPVRAECLEFQMEFEEGTGRRDGMFGGMTPKERDILADQRRRLRPQGRGKPVTGADC